MVNKLNKRVALTLEPKTLKRADELCEFYEMSYTELFKFMVNVFHQERQKK